MNTNLENDSRVVQIKDLNRLISTSNDHERVLHVQGAEGKKEERTRQIRPLSNSNASWPFEARRDEQKTH